MTLPKGDQLRRPLGSESRPCVGSTEHEDGALNGQVKPEGPGSQGVWAREQGAVLATKKVPFPSPPLLSASATRPSILIQRCLC